MNNIRIEEELILKKMEKLETITSDHYLDVYPHLLAHCKRQETNDMTTLVGIAHMVYGWMPTIVTFDTDVEIDKQVFEMISMGSLDYEFLNKLKSMVNNSIVGVSKLLHFMNSEDYAIWDSRVYSSITGSKGYNYKVNNIEAYISYMEQIKRVQEKLNMTSIRNVLIEKGYCTGEESDIRLLEIILFYSS